MYTYQDWLPRYISIASGLGNLTYSLYVCQPDVYVSRLVLILSVDTALEPPTPLETSYQQALNKTDSKLPRKRHETIGKKQICQKCMMSRCGVGISEANCSTFIRPSKLSPI